MSKPSHTPGPWKLENLGASYAVEPKVRAEVGWPDRIATVHRAHTENARLIAAAPELLEMVKRIPYMLDCDPECEQTDPEGQPMMDGSCGACRTVEEVKKLLAKAEGREE